MAVNGRKSTNISSVIVDSLQVVPTIASSRNVMFGEPWHISEVES